MKHFIILIISIFLFLGCSAKNDTFKKAEKSQINKKIVQLSSEIKSLSKNIDKEEADNIAFKAVLYSEYLANSYEVVKPALFHNLLINLKIKDRGLCYHYANDLLKYLSSKKYKSFALIKIVSSPGKYFEHTSLAITRDDIKFKNSIVLDAWRNSGDLYFSKIKDDKRYNWEKKQ